MNLFKRLFRRKERPPRGVIIIDDLNADRLNELVRQWREKKYNIYGKERNKMEKPLAVISEEIEETVAYSGYEVRERRPSQLGLDRERDVILGFTCPRCRTLCSAIEHGQTTACPTCGLRFQRWGNALECRGVLLNAKDSNDRRKR